MIVFDLDIREFEYAYRVDRAVPAGEGAFYDKKNILFGSVCKGGGRTALLGRYQKGPIMPEWCRMCLTGEPCRSLQEE